MPELPEVETVRRALTLHLKDQTVSGVEIRRWKLRQPIPPTLPEWLPSQRLLRIDRRGKCLLFCFTRASTIVHLGMSGSLRLVPPRADWQRHDHWQWAFGTTALRFHDPRRFGVLQDYHQHPHAIEALGREPLDEHCDGDYLYSRSRNKRQAVKSFIMQQSIIAGIGNIYACEALYQAGIDPRYQAGRVSKKRYTALAEAIKSTLMQAIDAGGTTLKDFRDPQGNRGYFEQSLSVYGREGLACGRCQRRIARAKGKDGRSTFYCPGCQHSGP